VQLEMGHWNIMYDGINICHHTLCIYAWETMAIGKLEPDVLCGTSYRCFESGTFYHVWKYYNMT
jgi:hypothetical protein